MHRSARRVGSHDMDSELGVCNWYSRAPSSQPLPSVDATDGETDPMRSTRTMATQSMCTYRRHLATPRFDYIAPRKEDGASEAEGETGTDR